MSVNPIFWKYYVYIFKNQFLLWYSFCVKLLLDAGFLDFDWHFMYLLYWPHWSTQPCSNCIIFILIIVHPFWNWHSSYVWRGHQHLQSSCITIPATWKLFICAMKKQPDNEPSETARKSVWQWTLLRGTSLIMHYKHNLHYKKFLLETCDRFLGYLWI